LIFLGRPSIAAMQSLPEERRRSYQDDFRVIMRSFQTIKKSVFPIGGDKRITFPEGAVESILGNGLSGPVHGYLAKIKTIKIGEYALHDVVTTFTAVSQDESVYGNTMIGLPLLRRFNITFDYPNDRMILEPIRTFDDPFPFPMPPKR
jgi:hypothetical protein